MIIRNQIFVYTRKYLITDGIVMIFADSLVLPFEYRAISSLGGIFFLLNTGERAINSAMMRT